MRVAIRVGRLLLNFVVFSKTLRQKPVAVQCDAAASCGTDGGGAQDRGVDAAAGGGDGAERGAGRVLWDMPHVWGEGDGRWTGVPGNGQLVSHELLHLLLVWTSVAGQGLLQRTRKGVLRGGLYGEQSKLACL